jgi:hypothetical protein
MNKFSFASIKCFLMVLVLMICLFSFRTLSLPTHAQTQMGVDMRKTTSGGTLDILLQPSPQPVGHTGPTSLKVKFMTKGSQTVQPHIDYDLVIKNSNGKQVFQASQLAGQPGKPLHTAEGVVTIPYTFQGPGDYSISIPVYGILFNPIKPESADFTIKVA